MKRNIIRLAYGVALVYVFLVALMFTFQRDLMYFPRGAEPDKFVQQLLPHGEKATVQTADGLNLYAYMQPPSNAEMPILLAFHGNGALGTDMIPPFNELIGKGYGILFAEYRGYAGNAGTPNENGLYNDADAYLRFLQSNFPDNKIIAYGQSLGSGVAVDVVSRHPDSFAALILEVPFDSILNVVRKVYPFVPFKGIMVRDKFLSDKKIGYIKIPKLFLIAGQDQVVGTESGMRLYGVSSEPKQLEIFPQAGHMDVYSAGAQNVVRDFIEKEIENEKHSIHRP